MRTKVLIIAAVLVLMLVMVTPVAAVVNGQPDGNGHPYVGLVAFYDEDGVPLWRCSGTLLAPTVFLTAGHCTDGAASAQVWFDTGPITPGNWVRGEPCTGFTGYPCTGGTTGAPHTEPGFCIACSGGLPGFDTHDVGVVVLDEDAPITSYGALPTEGLVDTLAMNTKVSLVGYGVQTEVRGGGPPYWTGTLTRMFAPTLLIQSNNVQSDQYIKLTANPALGKGGTCFGDSGGPDLLGNTNTVLAVNSYVTNNNCAGVTYSNRVDLGYALDFVESFMP